MRAVGSARPPQRFPPSPGGPTATPGGGTTPPDRRHARQLERASLHSQAGVSTVLANLRRTSGQIGDERRGGSNEPPDSSPGTQDPPPRWPQCNPPGSTPETHLDRTETRRCSVPAWSAVDPCVADESPGSVIAGDRGTPHSRDGEEHHPGAGAAAHGGAHPEIPSSGSSSRAPHARRKVSL